MNKTKNEKSYEENKIINLLNPNNMGSKWDENDNVILFKLLNKNKNIVYIAEKLGRSTGGVRGRLRRICKTLYISGKTADEIYDTIKIMSEEKILKWINQVDKEDKQYKDNDVTETKEEIKEDEKKINLINHCKKWDKNDNDNLIDLYNTKKYDIVKISSILGRTPISVSCQLINLKIIKEKEDARGYEDFLLDKNYQSKLKKEKKLTRITKKENQDKNILSIEYMNNNLNEIKNALNKINESIVTLENNYNELHDKIANNGLNKFNKLKYEEKEYYIINNDIYKINKDNSLGKYIGVFKKGNIHYE